MTAVLKSCLPFTPLRVFICVTMIVGTFGALVVLPSLFEVTPITAGMGTAVLAGAIFSLVLILLLEQVRRQKGEEAEDKRRSARA